MHGAVHHCIFADCNSDNRPGRPGYSPDVRFFKFPKPCLSYRNSGASRYIRNPSRALNVVSDVPAFTKRHISTCNVCRVRQKWVKQCGRTDSKFKSIADITKDTYICSKHFPVDAEELNVKVLPVHLLTTKRKSRMRRSPAESDSIQPWHRSCTQGTTGNPILNGTTTAEDPSGPCISAPSDSQYLVDVKLEEFEDDIVPDPQFVADEPYVNSDVYDSHESERLEMNRTVDPLKFERTCEELPCSDEESSPHQPTTFNVMAVIDKMRKLQRENDKLKEENSLLKEMLTGILTGKRKITIKKMSN